MGIIKNITHDNYGEAINANSLLSYLRLSNDHWHVNEKNNAANPEWIFRGQEDDSWKLIPSLWRYSPLQMSNICKRIELRRAAERPVNSDQTLYQFVYAFLLHRFARNADLVNLYAYNDLGLSKIFSDVLNGDGVELEALAQHHGVPSRLLDWTSNPIYAAYFAAEAGNRKRKEGNFCIYALDISRLNQVNPDRMIGGNAIVVKKPSYSITRYLGSQNGLFTTVEYQRYPNPFLGEMEHDARRPIGVWPSDHQNWPDIESLLEADQLMKSAARRRSNSPILKKIVVDRSEAKPLLRLLEREGVSKYTMQPSFDIIASELKKKFLPKRVDG